jgi:hypothetical protein
MRKIFFLVLAAGLIGNCLAQDGPGSRVPLRHDSLGAHKAVYDKSGKILPWYEPASPGTAYAHVSKIASEFIKSGTPIEPKTGLPLYLVTCCFVGPLGSSPEAFKAGTTGEDWMHNPAMLYAGMVHSLIMGYRVYSGDESYIKVVKDMLDYQLAHGTTPAGWVWPRVPYASSNPFEKEYYGATKWEHDGMRGDGLHGIEPDKVGELGYAYLLFYEVTSDTTYLNAALHCADALAKNIQDVKNLDRTKNEKSPWPFRLNARNGIAIDDYCSNVIEPIRLFQELIRIKSRIPAKPEQVTAWQSAHDAAWNWLFAKEGPMKTYVWNSYFEDVPNDPLQANRHQVSPMETARHLIRYPEQDENINVNVPSLLAWVESAFGTEGMDAIKEQTWCYEPMGSHTARFASICAMWYEYTGDEAWKEKAYRYFNNATYSCDPDGVVRVGPTWPSSWFSDGYSDYIRHFLDGFAAVPEWVPLDQDHVLRSSSAIQKISYSPGITIRTFDTQGKVSIRMRSKPSSVRVDGKRLAEKKTAGEGWTWKPLSSGGLLTIGYSGGNELTIK